MELDDQKYYTRTRRDRHMVRFVGYDARCIGGILALPEKRVGLHDSLSH